ncbi:MAG: hypothetical protein MUE51_02775, partial [Thermoleophilia bacterium]|nr:hypothetical protein [Thermoleophilia bacterium]
RPRAPPPDPHSDRKSPITGPSGKAQTPDDNGLSRTGATCFGRMFPGSRTDSFESDGRRPEAIGAIDIIQGMSP